MLDPIENDFLDFLKTSFSKKIAIRINNGYFKFNFLYC